MTKNNFKITNFHEQDLLGLMRNNEEPSDLKDSFREIRDYFAGNVTGITRDEEIAKNLMRIIFCKLYVEKNTKKSISKNRSEINSIFTKVKSEFTDLFEAEEKIDLNERDLNFIISKLENFSLLESQRDVIGEAFEEIIGTAFRGGEGQFFTPRNIVQMMIEGIDLKSGETILDPACGSGGFLANSYLYLDRIKAKKIDILGIEKDLFLAKIARTYLTILSNNPSSVFCENSLEVPTNWKNGAQRQIKFNSIDVILTNPPFGAKIPVVGEKILKQYELSKVIDRNQRQSKVKYLSKQAPQVLFIERCIQLLRPGGRLGIVLPEGIFGNPSDKYIWEYLDSVASIEAVVSLAQEAFQPSTHTKTSVLFLTKGKSPSTSVFLAIAKTIGHNKNGKPIYRDSESSSGIREIDDDIPLITKKLNLYNKGKKFDSDHLGFTLSKNKIEGNIYIPEYYNPEIRKMVSKLSKSKEIKLVTIGELRKTGILEMRRGNEIGSEHYGSGKIPFVRTSDLVNWEIKVDPIKCVSEEIYQEYGPSQDVKENDILFVSDGTFLIGRSAFVTKFDTKILIQSHVKKLRILKPNVLDPFYFFYLLNTNFVQKQVQSKTFIQATISTLGNRIDELELPLHQDKELVKEISKKIGFIIEEKSRLSKMARELVLNSI